MINGRKLLAGWAALALCGSGALGQETVQRTIEHDGETRRWLEYRPASLEEDGSAPVVLMLHPGLSTPERVAITSGWNAVADREGILMIYPAAEPGEVEQGGIWNAWDFEGAPTPDGLPQDVAERDDLGFLETIIGQATSRDTFAGDPQRVYLTGFSSGAQMVNTYLGAGGARVAAAAPVSGGWAEQFGVPVEFVRPARPLPVWIWAGEREENLEPNGVSRAIHDAAQLAFWLDFNGASDEPTSTETFTGTFERTLLLMGETFTRPVEQTFVTDFYADGEAEIRFTLVLDRSHEYHPGAAERIWETLFSSTTLPDSGSDCPADLTGGPDGGPDGALGADDFFEYLNLFASGDPDADLAGPGGSGPDGAIDANDFFEYLRLFAAGCP